MSVVALEELLSAHLRLDRNSCCYKVCSLEDVSMRGPEDVIKLYYGQWDSGRWISSTLIVWYFPHIKIGLSCVLVPSSEFRCKQMRGSFKWGNANVLIKEGALENGFEKLLLFLLFLCTLIVQDNRNASPTCLQVCVAVCSSGAALLLPTFQISGSLTLNYWIIPLKDQNA